MGSSNAAKAYKSNLVSQTGIVAGDQAPWAPPLVELAGRLSRASARLGTGRARWFLVGLGVVDPSGGSRTDHKVVLIRADSLRPLELPWAYKAVPRLVSSHDGQVRGPQLTASNLFAHRTHLTGNTHCPSSVSSFQRGT
jgi:hypothetical protein